MNGKATNTTTSTSSKEPGLVIAPVASLAPSMRHLTMKIMVLTCQELKRTKEGGFLSIFLVADQSGYIELTLWNNEAAAVQPGMILVLTNVYTQIFQERLRICIPKHGGSVKRVGEFTMIVHADSPNISDKRWIVDPSNSSRFIEKPNGTASCK